jgi:pimeloyl-ACP methyl ester carboxylesterase
MRKVAYRKVDIEGLAIHYRDAGPEDPPTILLLHGFPSVGHMFRDLIPPLDDRFRLVAPDMPGFGRSDMPSKDNYTYTLLISPRL